MAVIMRPSPTSELAKLLGQAAGTTAGLVGRESNIRSIADLYGQEFGYDPAQARALARNPQQAMAFMKVQAAKRKKLSEEEEKELEKRRAIENLENIKVINQKRKEQGKISKALGRIGSRIFGGDPSEQEIERRFEALKKNPLTKELGISIAKGTDDPDVIDALVDEDLSLLKGPEKAEQSEENITRSQMDQAENELDVQDVAAQAAPELSPNAPTDDVEEDEIVDPAAQQMAAEMGGQEPPQPPIEQQPTEQVLTQQQSVEQPQPQQQIGRRFAPGEQPQGTPLTGLPQEVANLGRSAAAGLFSGATLPVRALESARQYFNPPSQQAYQERREDMLRDQLGLEQLNPELKKRIQETYRKELNIPTREEVYKYLGGTETKSLLEKTGQEFVGDIAEQIPIAAMTGAFGSLSNVMRGLKYIGLTQAAGNFAKWLSKEAGESDSFANNAKLGATLLTAFGFAPQLKDVANDTYQKAEKAIPQYLTASAKNRVGIQDSAFELHQMLMKPKHGYVGDLNLLQPIISGNTVNYRQALDAVQKVRFGGFNLSEAARRANETFYQRIIRDIKNNPQVPKGAVSLFNKASDMWKNVKNSDEALSWLNTIPRIGRAMKADGLGGVVGLGLLSTYSAPAALLGTAAYGVKKGADLMKGMYLFSTSPGMRDYYLKMMNAAFQYDGAQATKYLFGLNDMIEKKTKRK